MSEFSQWHQLMGDNAFVLDLGFTPGYVQSANTENSMTYEVSRYSVFMPIPKQQKHQIVEVGPDLKALQDKYNIPDDRVVSINKPKGLGIPPKTI